MPWQRLCRPHVLKIRSLLEENYLPASANRMLSALRGVLKYQGGSTSERCDQVAGP
jgi:hypothetical protein